MNNELGKRIVELRKAADMSQADLGRACKIKREYLSKMEGGILDNPTLSTLERLSHGLNVTVVELLGGHNGLGEGEIWRARHKVAWVENAKLRAQLQRIVEAVELSKSMEVPSDEAIQGKD